MLRAVVVASLWIACSDPGVPPDLTVEQPGGWGVGTTRFTVDDATSGRMLVAQAWFPTIANAADTDITTLAAARAAAEGIAALQKGTLSVIALQTLHSDRIADEAKVVTGVK